MLYRELRRSAQRRHRDEVFPHVVLQQAKPYFTAERRRDLVCGTNATTGVNAVFRSLKLKPGDELLTTNVD